MSPRHFGRRLRAAGLSAPRASEITVILYDDAVAAEFVVAESKMTIREAIRSARNRRRDPQKPRTPTRTPVRGCGGLLKALNRCLQTGALAIGPGAQNDCRDQVFKGWEVNCGLLLVRFIRDAKTDLHRRNFPSYVHES